MAHAIEVHLSANVEKFNQGMAAAKKTTTENVGFIASIFNTVKSYFAGMWDSAKSFFSNLGDKAGAAWGSFKDSASGALEKVLSMLPGVGKATKDIGDEAEQSDKKTDSWLSKLKSALTAVIGIAVAAAAAIGALAAKGLLIDAAFAKISVSTNVGAGTLSQFQDVAKRSGMTIEQLGTSVSKFQDAMKEAAAGTGAGIFKELGVDVKDSNDKLLATGPTLVDFAKHVAGMSSEAEKYGAAAKAGFSVQFLEDLARAGKLAAGTTDDQAEKVERLGKIFHEILPGGVSVWEKISTALSNKLTPALTAASISVLESKNKIIDAFNQIYGGGSLFDKLGSKIGEWGNDLAGYFSKVVTGATDAGIKIMEFIGKATGLGKPMTSPPSVGDIPKQTSLASGKPEVVPTKADADAAKKYDEWTKSIKGLVEAQELEKQSGAALTQGQRMQLALTDGLRDGTIKETGAQLASRQALVDKVLANEKQIASSRQAQSDADALVKKQAQNYAGITASIQSKIAQDELELLTGNAVTEGQKLAIKIQKDLEASKKTLTAAQITDTEAQLAALDVVEKRMLQAKAQKEVTNYIEEGTIARSASRNALEAEYEAYGKSSDALALLMVGVNAQTEMQKVLDKLRKDGLPVSAETIEKLEAETAARTKAGQADLGQGNALKYATQLADENKKFAAESIFDEKGRAAALLAIDAKIWQDRIKLEGDGTEAQKALQTQYDIWYSNQSLKPQIEEQRKMWDSIENTAHDTFVSIFDSGKSAFDRLRDTLKNGLLDLLYQMTVKKWIMSIGASVTATGAAGIAQAAGGATAAPAATGLVGTAASVGGLLGGASLFGAGGVAGSLAAGAGWVAGSTTLGGALGAGTSLLATGSAAGIASGIGMVAGAIAPIALGIFAAVKLWDKAFGMGDKQVTATGMSGTLSDSGLTGTNYQKWKQDGGWFRSDKSGTDKTAFNAEVVAQFTQGFATIKAASAGFATSIGASTDSLVGYSKTFDIALGKDATANEKAITDFFTGVGDEIALRLVPGLSQFNKSGETMATTLQRLAGDFDATNQIAMLLGKNGTSMFGSLTIDSAAARERLIDLAGGVSNLASQATAFAQNYLTEAERLKPVSEAVAAAMASIGMASVTTREQFKTVVQGLDVTTAAGAQQFASLMALSDAFAQVTPAIDSTASAVRSASEILSEYTDLRKQYNELTMTEAELEANRRNAIAPANRDLYDQLQIAKKVRAAQDEARTSLGNFLSQTKTFATTVAGLNGTLALGSLSTLTPAQQYAEARRQFEQTRDKAAGGDAAAQSALQSVENTFLTLSQKLNGGDSQYSSDLAGVLKANDQLAAWSAGQVDVAQASLNALNEQVDGITQLNATMLSVAQNMQYLPTLTGNVSTPVFATPASMAVDFSAYGTAITAPLIAEIKLLREEVAGRRADAVKQTGDGNNVTIVATQQAAETIVAGVRKAIVDDDYAAAESIRKFQ